jgi:imidazolonepropionase-like amidohydrolase
MLVSSRAFALVVALLSSALPTARSCLFHGDSSHLARIDYHSLAAANVAARSTHNHKRETSSTPIVLQNVRVFNGTVLLPPSTVVINGTLISRPCDPCPPAKTYDAQGKTLLPGLIDSHSHPANASHLINMTSFGVTTAVSAFCPAPEFCASLNNHTGLTSIVSASFFATSPGSQHAMMVPPSDAPLLINSSTDALSFVSKQVAQGADFIKLIGSAPLPGLSQGEQTALVAASHQFGKQVVLHTSSYVSYNQGLVAGVDQIHHSTLDKPVDDRLINMFKARNTIVCPTLTMMRAIVQQDPSANGSYSAAAETVTRLHQVGVPILAGTDANMQPLLPAMVLFGSSLHDELENLVAAGLSPVEALNAATVLPAKYFGLADRGIIKEGMRADLLLVDGDPTTDITATRRITKVWVNGVEFDGGNSTASSNGTASSSGTASSEPSPTTVPKSATSRLVGSAWAAAAGLVLTKLFI